MKKVLAFLVAFILLLVSLPGCGPSEEEQLKKEYFDSGIATATAEKFVTLLMDSLKKKGLITDENVRKTGTDIVSDEEDGSLDSRGFCVLSIYGYELSVEYLFSPGKRLVSHSSTLYVKTKEVSSADQIEGLPDALKDTVSEILLLFKRRRTDTGKIFGPSVEDVSSGWSRKCLIENFDKTSYPVYVDGDRTKIRYEVKNFRRFGGAEIDTTVYCEQKNGSPVYYMDYKITLEAFDPPLWTE